ncbi:MAG: acyl-CoA thioesterase [Pseudomonadota bacterium]
MFSYQHQIFFGDCDPAGIMFYPHHFRLMDATFQAWLASIGLSQAKLQKEFGIIGTGLLDASATFQAPVREGDTLKLKLTIGKWSGKSVQVDYKGFVGDTFAIEGKEVRGLFNQGMNGLKLSSIESFRNLIVERGNDGQD